MALDYEFPPVLPGLPLGRTEGGMANARAKRIFGIPIDKLRLGLRGFAGGLAAGMGAENPQAGFAAGLAGSLGTIDSIAAARAKAEQEQAEQERQMLMDELKKRQIESGISLNEARMQTPDPTRDPEAAFAEWVRKREWDLAHKDQPDPNESFTEWVRRKQWERENPDPNNDPLYETVTDIMGRDINGYPTQTRTRRIRKSERGIPPGFSKPPAPAYNWKTGEPLFPSHDPFQGLTR